ncbi:hypothetical protein GO013_10460 [Pseudodesulfovibrio sp. JC047]|uniref:hypothetical protein n=1 Tax=Pseudodesulfovibrio sp. JC047 TaxID=2683199 RepID=UPI0013D5C5F7|nr:hypothetical protein [Pseudodesulfovibrio sp. JC047]NDV19842.1 hypothetical protein [Pseudodesulfovibrio sp. JC047]
MHGIYYVILPLFAVLLVLLSASALYMGVFRAHGDTVSYTKKVFSGIASGVVSCLVWSILYSHHFLGW